MWQTSLEKVSKYFIPGAQIINIGDRGNDMFTFFSYCKNSKWHYVIRAKYDRTITQNNQRTKLFDFIKSAPIKAKKVIYLKEEPIELNLSWESVKITIPKNIKQKNLCHNLDLYIIRCANEKHNIEWILLTNLALEKKEDAFEKVEWYSARWLIEEYHKCLKTGCAIEKRNLKIKLLGKPKKENVLKFYHLGIHHPDYIHAAIAFENCDCLVTFNIKDFEKIRHFISLFSPADF